MPLELDRSKSPREISRSRSNERPCPRKGDEERKREKLDFPPEIFLTRRSGVATLTANASDGAEETSSGTTLDSACLLFVFCYIRITLCECALLDAILNERCELCRNSNALRLQNFPNRRSMLLDSKNAEADRKFVGSNPQFLFLQEKLH